MNFTPKNSIGTVTNGILTIAVVGLIEWVSHVAIAPAQMVPRQDAFAVKESLQTSNLVAIVPARWNWHRDLASKWSGPKNRIWRW